jgi:hypothetical protein
MLQRKVTSLNLCLYSLLSIQKIPRKYTRTSDRGQRSQDSLQCAMEQARTGGMNCFKAPQEYGITYTTLKRRLEKKDDAKHGMDRESKQYLSMCDVNYVIYNITRFYDFMTSVHIIYKMYLYCF